MNTKKRLVFFDFITHYGGAQRCTVLLCEQLVQSYEVHIVDAYGVCNNYTEALADQNIPTHVLLPDAKTFYIGHRGKPFKRAWSLIRQAWTLLRLRAQLIRQISQINPDLIWTNSSKALLFLVTSLRLRKYPVAMYAHGWYRKSQVSALGRWLIRKADGVLAVSNPTAQALKSWGVSEKKIRVVFNTIDFDAILASNSREPQASLPGTDADYKILLPGQLLRTKGQHTAVEAASLLKRKGLSFVMWLVGDLKMGDASNYSDYLVELIRTNGLEDQVFLLGWRGDARSLMSLSDVVILPTHTEGLPRVVQEAMILNRPVIATPVGGVADLIIDGETGLLVPVEDANALADNLERLMRNRDLARKIAEKGNKRILEDFSTEKHVQLVRKAFEAIIAKKRKR